MICRCAQEVRRFAAQPNPGVEVARPFHPVCTLDFVLKFDERLSASIVASGAMKELLLGLGESENPLIQKDVLDMIMCLCNSQPDLSKNVIVEVFGSPVGPAVWRHVLPHLGESASKISRNAEQIQFLRKVARTCGLDT
jgi:hypothetical protein